MAYTHWLRHRRGPIYTLHLYSFLTTLFCPVLPSHMQLLTVQAGGDEDCAVCLSEMQQPCITLCAHVFCRACIEKVIRWVSRLPNYSIGAPIYNTCHVFRSASH